MKRWLLRFLRLFQPGAQQAPWLRTLAIVTKVVIMVCAFVYIGQKLYHEGDTLLAAWQSLQGGQWVWALLALVLMPVNLGWEAAKWRLMVRQVYPHLSYITAYGAIVVGITSGIFTPNGIGAYAGRVFWLEAGRRLEAVVLTLGDRLCQMAITLWTGLVAWEYAQAQTPFILQGLPDPAIGLVNVGLWAGSLLALALVLFPHVLGKMAQSVPGEGKFMGRIATTLFGLPPKKLWQVLGLGFLRYLTFSFQYLCLLTAFGYTGTWGLAFTMISLVFFLKSLLPSMSFSELGVRESMALLVMSAADIPSATIVAATFSLYVMNQILPASLGLWLAPRLKIDWKL